jgi:hypothetical protein
MLAQHQFIPELQLCLCGHLEQLQSADVFDAGRDRHGCAAVAPVAVELRVRFASAREYRIADSLSRLCFRGKRSPSPLAPLRLPLKASGSGRRP